jgi:uncharacterized protein (TIGR02996 family)
MSDEAAFLNHLRDHPRDDTARMVYADWLEERDTDEATAKAEYLRCEAELVAFAADDPRRPAVEERMRLLSLGLPLAWRKTVAKVAVHCGVTWTPCPKRWDELGQTTAPGVRHCDTCDQDVTYCDDPSAAESMAASGGCLALDVTLNKKPGEFPQSLVPGGATG